MSTGFPTARARPPGRRAFAAAACAAAVLIAAVLAVPTVPKAPELCPADMPGPEALDPVFLLGSASGNSYYAEFRDQLVECGWPADKVTILEKAAHTCIDDDVAEMADAIESRRLALGAERIGVVGYSLGAVRARSYIAKFGGWRRVRAAVLWGGPNLGVPYNAGAECWNAELKAGSEYINCLRGAGEPSICENPFRAAMPMSVAARDAESGIVYTNVYSDDRPCSVCLAFGGGIWEASDGVVPGAFARMTNVYNVDLPWLAHWDYFNATIGKEVFRVSMLGLLGRAPAPLVDGDGFPEAQDNCPFVKNQDQADEDGDGLGDACDPCPGLPGGDRDSDGVCDAEDNCPEAPNPDQADADGDGVADACDPCPYDAAAAPDGKGICPTPDPDASASQILREVVVMGRVNRTVGDAAALLLGEAGVL